MKLLPRLSALCLLAFSPALRAQETGRTPASASAPTPTPTPAPIPAAPPGQTEHVVLMVWDGLRADSASDEATPNLAKLARGGVTFTRHHSIYPSSTEVNGTAMATGCFPRASGILGNRMYLPAIDPLRPVATEEASVIRAGDQATSGKYLTVPTMAELIHTAGGRTATAGTKNVALLFDRAEPRPGTGLANTSVTLFNGSTEPPEAANAISIALGSQYPLNVTFPNVDEDAWTTKALVGSLWKDGVPKLSVLWMSDVDFTQHKFGPGSPQAGQALASCDANLGRVLDALDAKGVRDKTDVFVVSDHGFSTLTHPVDVAEDLVKAGFDAVREFKGQPEPGQILVNGLGGAVFFYVIKHDALTVARLTEHLQTTAFAGALFSRDPLPGTFTLDAVHLDLPDDGAGKHKLAPDLVLAMRWDAEKNVHGLPGTMYSDAGKKSVVGNHASLSRFDLHNTLIAAGPDLRAGLRSELPSSNVDLAPTILHILGVNENVMDGRVLDEALVHPKDDAARPAPATGRLEVEHQVNGKTWRQYLQVTSYGGETYIDEGNAVDAEPKADEAPAQP